MAASVAGSSGTPRKTKSSGFRAEKSAVNQLANGIAMNHRLQEQSERDYVVARLDGADHDLVKDLAHLLRNDTLRRAVEKLMSKGSCNGKELPPSIQHFRALRDGSAKLFLQQFEPDVFTDDTMASLTRQEKLQLLTFALGVGLADELPALSPALRFCGVLADYMHARYTALGRRLQHLTAEDMKDCGYFHLDLDASKVSCNIVVDGSSQVSSIEMPILREATDWQVVQNTSLEGAVLKSDESSASIAIASHFRKTKTPLPQAETLEWNIPRNNWPTQMLQTPRPLSDQAGSPASLSASSGRKRKLPPGCGRASK